MMFPRVSMEDPLITFEFVVDTTLSSYPLLEK